MTGKAKTMKQPRLMTNTKLLKQMIAFTTPPLLLQLLKTRLPITSSTPRLQLRPARTKRLQLLSLLLRQLDHLVLLPYSEPYIIIFFNIDRLDQLPLLVNHSQKPINFKVQLMQPRIGQILVLQHISSRDQSSSVSDLLLSHVLMVCDDVGVRTQVVLMNDVVDQVT